MGWVVGFFVDGVLLCPLSVPLEYNLYTGVHVLTRFHVDVRWIVRDSIIVHGSLSLLCYIVIITVIGSFSNIQYSYSYSVHNAFACISMTHTTAGCRCMSMSSG